MSLFFASLAAPAVRAQIAIAPVVQNDEVTHRDIVGAIATALRAQHELLSPWLDDGAIAACRDDVECLIGKARAAKASHLVVISAAPLGARDHVVGVTVFAVDGGAKLYEENAVLSTTRDVRAAAAALGGRVADIDGLPRRTAPAEVPQPEAAGGLGTLGTVGLGLLGGGAVAIIATGIVGTLMLMPANPYPRAVAPMIIAGTSVTGALAIGGVVLLVLDPGE